MAVEIIPAILSKTRGDFEAKVKAVAPYVKRVQIDIMDGQFVPNETLQPEKFPPLPKKLGVEYHLMVKDPLDYVKRIGRKGATYELHIETLTDIPSAIAEVKKMGGKVALALSPDTPARLVEPYIGKVEHILVMTVYPGFSGQKYLQAMEEKMSYLKSRGAKVEIDGGVDIGTAKRAARAGATLLNVASGIFAKPSVKKAIAELKKDAAGK